MFLLDIWVLVRPPLARHSLEKQGSSFSTLIGMWRIVKIPQIFAEKGEAGFRELERNMLHEVTEFEDVVISCGGGTPCFFDNIDYMNSLAETVYLKAEPEVLRTHLLMAKSQRPLIQGKTPDELRDFIKESLADREPFYAKAKHIVQIEVLNSRELIDKYVDKICQELAL